MQKRDKLLVAVALVTAAGGAAIYSARGYSDLITVMWCLALLCGALVCFLHRTRFAVDRRTLVLTVCLGILLAPLYLVAVDRYPLRLTGDEVNYMSFWLNNRQKLSSDPFGLFWYWWNIPNATWLVPGFCAKLLGFDQVTLAAMRTVHACEGLLSVLLCFWLYANVLPRRWAFVIAVLLGTQHVMCVTSRFASIDNLQMVALAACFNFAVRAHRHRCLWFSFLVGAAAAGTLYFNFPGRMVPFIVGIFFLWKRPSKAMILSMVLGGLLFCWPVAISICKDIGEGTKYSRIRTLLYDEGRKIQQHRFGTRTQSDGVWLNIVRGLTMYNSRDGDTWGLYVNPYSGFVDPVSGCLLWVGIGSTFFTVSERRLRLRKLSEISDVDGLLLINFWSYYLALAFIANLAPIYGRAILTLPSVEFFVGRAVIRLGRLAGLIKPAFQVLISAQLLILIGSVNLWAGWQYCKLFEVFGDATGSLFRYARAHREQPIYVVYGFGYRVLEWGGGVAYDREYLERVMEDAGATKHGVIRPDELDDLYFTRPTALVMNPQLWTKLSKELKKKGRVLSTSSLSPYSLIVELAP